MKDIKIKMTSTVDKTLYYPQGAFVMGIKGDNNTSRVIFEVPSVYKQKYGVVVVIPPSTSGIIKQTPIPLIELESEDKGLYCLNVSGDLTQFAGEWTIVLMLSGEESDDTPICVSDKIIAIVKDTEIDPDNFEPLPENSNIKILYNEMRSCYEKIEQTLLTADISTVQEIEEDLKKILNSMESMMSIDWTSIENLASVGEDMEEIKTGQVFITENTNTLLEDNVTLKNDHETILNAIDTLDDKVGEDDTTIFTHLNNIFSIGMGTQNMIQSGVINTLSQVIANTNNTNSMIGTVNDELAAL